MGVRIFSALITVFLFTAMACGGGEQPPGDGTTVAVEDAAAPTPDVTVAPSPTPGSDGTPTSEATVIPTATPKPLVTEAILIPTGTPTSHGIPTGTPTSDGASPYTKVELESGLVARDFELALLDGESLQLFELRGSVVVLNFWASWCPPCRWEMPAFESIWREYRDRGVVFVGVAVSDQRSDAQAFADKVGVTYPLGLDDSGDITRAYKVLKLPTTILIDREGNEARKIVNAANEAVLRIFLDGLLN